MKQEVTYDEMNAAVLLLVGVPLQGINEIHISPSGITTVFVVQTEDGDLENRVHIGRLAMPPQPPAEADESPEEEEPTDESKE